jgi:(1->4)-alpha-D-glucan 1-alpha-D-glucosylmutase
MPEAFAGSYGPVDAGPGVVAFTRGDAVLAAAAVDPNTRVRVPDGWRDVLGLPGLALCVRDS